MDAVMFLIVNNAEDPAWNLALEERLFDMAGESGRSFVMFWRNSPSVIIGRFQNTFEEINEAAVASAGVKVIRRPTGGGAVYHDLGNLNYSLVVANDNPAEFDFRALADPVLKTLRRLGVPAELSGRNDLTVNGQKFSGTARRAAPGRVMYHGTLLYDVDLDRLAQMLKVDPVKYESKGVKSVRSRVSNLKPWLPADLTLEGLERELVSDINAPLLRLTADDLAAVQKIKENKYDRWEWNWGGSPEFTVRKEKRFSWGKICLLLNVADGYIQKARIFGDFFSAELNALEADLHGLPYGFHELQEALKPLSDLIVGAESCDITELLGNP